MRTDMKALLGVFAAGVFVAVLVMGVFTAAALGVIPLEAAAAAALIGIVAGGVLIGRVFSRGLLMPARPLDRRD